MRPTGRDLQEVAGLKETTVPAHRSSSQCGSSVEEKTAIQHPIYVYLLTKCTKL